MTEDNKVEAQKQAYELGEAAYRSGDDCFATADDALVKLRAEGGTNIGVLVKAYNCGYNDTLRKAISS